MMWVWDCFDPMGSLRHYNMGMHVHAQLRSFAFAQRMAPGLAAHMFDACGQFGPWVPRKR